MDCEHTIDRSRRLVTTRVRGRITPVEIFQCQTSLRNHPSFDPSFWQLLDFQGATFEVSGATMQHLAQSSVFDPTIRRAIVVDSDASYGIARIFQTFREINGEAVRIFRSLDEATAWLSDSDQVQVPPHI